MQNDAEKLLILQAENTALQGVLTQKDALIERLLLFASFLNGRTANPIAAQPSPFEAVYDTYNRASRQANQQAEKTREVLWWAKRTGLLPQEATALPSPEVQRYLLSTRPESTPSTGDPAAPAGLV